MGYRNNITAEYARQLLHYDPNTGGLFWKPRTLDEFEFDRRAFNTWTARFCGKEAGWINDRGYRVIGIEGTYYRGHRLAWLIFYGEWPKDQIDHKNGIRHDNKIENFREANGFENHQNVKRGTRNTSGFIGVSWHAQMSKWVAYLTINGRRYCLGLHQTPELAYSAYLAAKKKYHPFQPVPRGGS